jgi:hypothetical protein
MAQGVGSWVQAPVLQNKTKQKHFEGWEYSLLVECMPSMHKALGSFPAP